MPKDAFHSLLGEVGSMETKKDQEHCHWLGLRQKLNLIVFYCCLLIYTHGWLIEEGETIAYYLRNKIVWWKVLQSWESVMVFLPLSFQVLPYGFSLSLLLWGHPESLNNIRFVSRSSGDDEEDMGWGDRRETTIDRTAPSMPCVPDGHAALRGEADALAPPISPTVTTPGPSCITHKFLLMKISSDPILRQRKFYHFFLYSIPSVWTGVGRRGVTKWNYIIKLGDTVFWKCIPCAKFKIWQLFSTDLSENWVCHCWEKRRKRGFFFFCWIF